MAGSLNKVLLIGRLGADPEIKQMVNGKNVARLSLATSQSWKDKNTGEKKEKTNESVKSPGGSVSYQVVRERLLAFPFAFCARRVPGRESCVSSVFTVFVPVRGLAFCAVDAAGVA